MKETIAAFLDCVEATKTAGLEIAASPRTEFGRAMIFAIAAHEAIGQTRKYTGEPYWHHCNEVVAMFLVGCIINGDGSVPEYASSAACLHDVLEDTKVSEATLRQFFSAGTVDLVVELTDISKPEDGNRARRKAIDRAHLAGSSTLAKLIKCADMISNSRSIINGDPAFATVYMKEKVELLNEFEFHIRDHLLYKIARSMVNDYYFQTKE